MELPKGLTWWHPSEYQTMVEPVVWRGVQEVADDWCGYKLVVVPGLLWAAPLLAARREE